MPGGREDGSDRSRSPAGVRDRPAPHDPEDRLPSRSRGHRDRARSKSSERDRRRSRSRSHSRERSRRSRSRDRDYDRRDRRRSRSPRRSSRSPRRRPSSPVRPGCQLFVAGFNFICNEKDVIRKFSRYGNVKDVRLVRGPGGESRGFGFIDMEREEDAKDAIRGLDQTEWNGRRLLVEVAKRPRTF